jgi:preprotein translocase subunit SecA
LPPSLDPSVYVPPTRPSVRRFVSRPTARDGRELGRNDPCWCGSSKKLKNCHGA